MSDEEDNAYLEDEEAAVEGEDIEDENKEVDSSEEEEDGQNEYVEDDFLVAEDEEVVEEEGEAEEGSGDEAKKRKKKKKKRRRQLEELDEDDYELLEENRGVSVRRPSGMKRLKKMGGDDRRERVMDERDLEEDLFGPQGGDLEDEFEDDHEYGGRSRLGGEENLDAEEFDDDEDDFIDDGGGPARRRRKAPSEYEGVSRDALEEAEQIFGDVDQLLEVYLQQRENNQLAAAEEEEEEEEEPEERHYSDEEEAEAARRERVEARRDNQLKKALRVVDPETLAAHHLLPQDQIIRDVDLPERYQLLGKIVEEPIDYEQAAEWIFQQLFVKGRTLARQIVEDGIIEVEGGEHMWEPEILQGASEPLDLRGRRALRAPRVDKESVLENEEFAAQLQHSIKNVLNYLFAHHEEVPMIATYRKPQCGELLCLHDEDQPVPLTERELAADDLLRDHFRAGMIAPKSRRIRRWDVLWAIFHQSLKYMMLMKRKRTRLAVYEDVRQRAEEQKDDTVDDDPSAWLHVQVGECITALEEATSMEAVDDVDHKFLLVVQGSNEGHLRALQLDGPGGGVIGANRRPQRPSRYKQWRQANLHSLVKVIGMPASAFGENVMSRGYKKHSCPDPAVDPTTLANTFLAQMGSMDGELTTAERVLKAAKTMMAVELAHDPRVRKVARDMFQRNLLLSTDPTEAGSAILDPFHKYGLVKRLRGKELVDFARTDLFLRVHHAEKDGLVTVRIQLAEGAFEGNILPFLREMYLSSSMSRVAREWNAFREEVLRELMLNWLQPAITRELRKTMLQEAQEHAVRNCGGALWRLASRPPLRIRVLNSADEEEFMDRPRIMAICWGPGTPATVAVMMDQWGHLVDYLQLGQLSGSIPRDQVGGANGFDDAQNKMLDAIFSDPKKSKDAERIRSKVMEHAPNFIIIGASSPHCRQLHDDVTKVCNNIMDNTKWVNQNLENIEIDVKYADERVASLWEKCSAAREELPDQPPAVRRAVALARWFVDPLAVLASLAGPKKEILSLPLNDMQHLLPKDQLATMVEQVLVTAVNQVGADINVMAAYPWRASTLQYVAGLGPRKAQHMLKAIQNNGNGVVDRFSLYKKDGDAAPMAVLGKKVFRNASGFLRIRSSELMHLANLQFERLDDSRIHPTNYGTALDLAGLAVKEKDFESVVRNPGALLNIDLQDVAVRAYDRPDDVVKLVDISLEFLDPFGEIRDDQRLLMSEDQIFYALHGETEDSLREGRLVEVKVVRIFNDDVWCVTTNSNVECMIARDQLTSQDLGEGYNLKNVVQVGQVLSARIIAKLGDANEKTGRLALNVSTRSDVLNDVAKWETIYCKAVEPCYHIMTEEELAAKQREIREKARQRKKELVMHRPIKHMAFENISNSEVLGRLGPRPFGSYLLRPSKELTAISLSIKVADWSNPPIIWQIRVDESAKKGGLQAMLRLGLPLKVKLSVGKGQEEVEQYEDIDELVARFVEPMVEHIRVVTWHHKFHAGDRISVDQHLKQERQRQGPQSSVYCLALDSMHVWHFYIGFIVGSNPHHEYFRVVPKGFIFRDRLYPSVDHVIGAFKKDPRNDAQRKAAQGPALGSSNPYAGQRYQQGTQYRGGPQGPPGNYGGGVPAGGPPRSARYGGQDGPPGGYRRPPPGGGSYASGGGYQQPSGLARQGPRGPGSAPLDRSRPSNGTGGDPSAGWAPPAGGVASTGSGWHPKEVDRSGSAGPSHPRPGGPSWGQSGVVRSTGRGAPDGPGASGNGAPGAVRNGTDWDRPAGGFPPANGTGWDPSAGRGQPSGGPGWERPASNSQPSAGAGWDPSAANGQPGGGTGWGRAPGNNPPQSGTGWGAAPGSSQPVKGTGWGAPTGKSQPASGTGWDQPTGNG